MERRRVLLLCARSLLGESLERLLRQEADVELIGPWELDGQAVARLSAHAPDAVLIAEGESRGESAAALTAQILERYPEIPVICVGLRRGTLRVYSSQTAPASAADLMETIRSL